MKAVKTAILTTLGLALTTLAGAQSLSITDTGSASDLANALAGAGVTISNVVLIGQAPAGAPSQQGFFDTTLGGNIVGIKSGIVLTNGTAHGTIGPNQGTSNYSNKNWGTAGDADLSNLIGGSATYDANVLSFDFTVAPNVKNLGFTYVFGTEEFPQYVNAFNDPFGFFVDGKNVALIPGTNDPVTVNTIASGANSVYFVNNVDGHLNVHTNGLTVPLFADVQSALNPNLTTHHLKLAVADALDHVLDSVVFIQAGSFTEGGGQNNTPEPGSLAMLAGMSVTGAGFLLRRRVRK